MDAIRLEAITKHYEKNLILSNISCQFPFGTSIIRGKNGVGKSTLLKIIAGIGNADNGKVILSSPVVNKRVSYFSNGTGLYPQLSVFENLSFFSSIYNLEDNSIESVLECWGLLELKKKTVSTLSAGQQAKVGIARSFLGNPSVLIFDEPTAFLDSASIELFEMALTHIDLNNQVVLIATHDLERLQHTKAETFELKEGGLWKL
jgi:ABC-type multidrug transport system ATPase subunit